MFEKYREILKKKFEILRRGLYLDKVKTFKSSTAKSCNDTLALFHPFFIFDLEST